MITVIDERTMKMSTYNDFEELEILHPSYDGHWVVWDYEPSKTVERGIAIESTTYTNILEHGITLGDSIGFYKDVI